MKHLATVLSFIAISFGTKIGNAQTDGEVSSKISHRAEKKWGTYLSILGDPAPTLFGVNGAYNALDFLRLNVGFGQVSVGIGESETTVTTLGAGAKAMVPGWSFSPFLGIGYSSVFISGDQEVTHVAPNNVYTSLGIDWQTKGGFNLGAGVNIALTDVSFTAPFLNLGWFL